MLLLCTNTGKEERKMKEMICTIFGVIGSAIASFFGGWDAGLATLLIFMCLDYVCELFTKYQLKLRKQRD